MQLEKRDGFVGRIFLVIFHAARIFLYSAPVFAFTRNNLRRDKSRLKGEQNVWRKVRCEPKIKYDSFRPMKTDTFFSGKTYVSYSVDILQSTFLA